MNSVQLLLKEKDIWKCAYVQFKRNINRLSIKYNWTRLVLLRTRLDLNWNLIGIEWEVRDRTGMQKSYQKPSKTKKQNCTPHVWSLGVAHGVCRFVFWVFSRTLRKPKTQQSCTPMSEVLGWFMGSAVLYFLRFSLGFRSVVRFELFCVNCIDCKQMLTDAHSWQMLTKTLFCELWW